VLHGSSCLLVYENAPQPAGPGVLQDNCLVLIRCTFLVQVVWMCEDYYSILSTRTEAD